MSKKVFIRSFGCQMNKLDTALVISALKAGGFDFTDTDKDADVVLINTCSVRQHAEERVLSHIGNLSHLKKNRPDVIVGIIGCMAQRLGNELLKNQAVDLVCGPAQIPRITEIVNQALAKNGKVSAVTDKIRQIIPPQQSQALEDFESLYDTEDDAIPAHAYVRVMHGCNKFCTYCVVPYVRGPEISRSPQTIIEQIKRLAGQGIKVITLLGQTVNSYKYTSGDKTYCLADILEMSNAIEGIEWIKFVTSYPEEEFFDEICHAMANLPKVCKYLHIPAQSGSDKILKAMNRHYTTSRYLGLLERARAIVPGIAVAGDFIVGFPDETEEDFQQSVELVKQARYKNAFIFKYSPRPGTTSEKRLEDNIPAKVKKQRNNALLDVQTKISDELSWAFLNTEVTVFVEGQSKKPHLNNVGGGDNPQLIGRTGTDWIVVFNGPKSLAGRFAKVKITKVSPLTLFGQMLPIKKDE